MHEAHSLAYLTHSHMHVRTRTHNRFMALLDFVGTTQVSWHQKDKTNLDLLKQEIVVLFTG